MSNSSSSALRSALAAGQVSEAPGPKRIELPFGARRGQCGHADESAIAAMGCVHRGFVALGMAMAPPPDEPDQKLYGLYCSMTPNHARDFAAGLIEAADQLDQGKGKQ